MFFITNIMKRQFIFMALPA